MNEELFVSQEFTPVNGFTSGIEGPACDAEGNLYAVNYARQHTIGKVTPAGEASVFVELQAAVSGTASASIVRGICSSRIIPITMC